MAAEGVLFLILIAVVLHILDRQGDFVARTDFLWKAKLKVEQEEVETMRGINKVRNNESLFVERYPGLPKPKEFVNGMYLLGAFKT